MKITERTFDYEGGKEARAYDFVTALGCTLTVAPAPEHLGPGVMLYGQMRQPGDGRRFEVYLDPASILALTRTLHDVWTVDGPLAPPRLRSFEAWRREDEQ